MLLLDVFVCKVIAVLSIYSMKYFVICFDIQYRAVLGTTFTDWPLTVNYCDYLEIYLNLLFDSLSAAQPSVTAGPTVYVLS